MKYNFVSFLSSYQVIFSQAEIVSLLSDYVKTGTEVSLQPGLELVSAVATDLQQEFCPHLQSVLNILMDGPFKIRCVNHIN